MDVEKFKVSTAAFCGLVQLSPAGDTNSDVTTQIETCRFPATFKIKRIKEFDCAGDIYFFLFFFNK